MQSAVKQSAVKQGAVKWLMVGVIAVGGCGESPDDIIDEFVAESGLAFADCGSGASCDAAGACLLSAFASCAPSRATLADGTYFVLPDPELGCQVVWFTGADTDLFEKYQCLSIGNTQSGCAEKEACEVRNRWHL